MVLYGSILSYDVGLGEIFVSELTGLRLENCGVYSSRVRVPRKRRIERRLGRDFELCWTPWDGLIGHPAERDWEGDIIHFWGTEMAKTFCRKNYFSLTVGYLRRKSGKTIFLWDKVVNFVDFFRSNKKRFKNLKKGLFSLMKLSKSFWIFMFCYKCVRIWIFWSFVFEKFFSVSYYFLWWMLDRKNFSYNLFLLIFFVFYGWNVFISVGFSIQGWNKVWKKNNSIKSQCGT